MKRDTFDKDAMRFLLVEDDTVASIDLECILEDMGHSVTAVAGSRSRAGEELMAHSHEIDAVILDDVLAGQSSLPLMDALNRVGIPCVIASEHGEELLRRMGFRWPTVEKPYSADGVATALARMRAA